MIDYGVIEAYTYANGSYENRRNYTYKNRSKCIDTVLIITGLMEYLNECIMTKFNEILLNNYYRYIVDIALEDYFNTTGNYVDKLEVSRLNLRKLSYHIKFIEKVKEILDET